MPEDEVTQFDVGLMPGRWPAAIVDKREGFSAVKQTPMAIFDIVITDGPSKDVMAEYQCPTKGKGVFKLHRLLEALEVDSTKGYFTKSEVLGNPLIAVIEEQTFERKDGSMGSNARIVDVAPISAGSDLHPGSSESEENAPF